MKNLVLYILLSLFASSSYSQSKETTIKSSWEFRKKGSQIWFPAIVPGNIHTDLLLNEQIPDPFFSDNEKKVQWIENEDWEYKTTFDCNGKTLSQNNIELKFEGLDTYAKVYLNNQLILETNNMFRSWLVDVKKLIQEKDNSLLIVFESAVKRGKAEALKLTYTLPGDEKVFTRKAQYQYGWDWAPRFVTCGIWKPIKLITWNNIKIESIYATTREIKDSVAKVDFIIETKCESEGLYNIKYKTEAAGKNQVTGYLNKSVKLKTGISTTTITTTISNAKLWWCNGIEKQKPYLYIADFKITLADSIICQQKIEYGIRTIELIRDKDSVGSSFYFKLNGLPLFMKGANYIPQNSFLPSIQRQEYRKLVSMAKEANMNMLRVWGGGVYADEEFYRNCDRSGILVWQDFMFACAMYPGDKEFIENVKLEAIENIKTLRSHPCLALWCGNNEIDEGWNNWGWQKQFNYSKTDSIKIFSDYKNLFHEILPSLVKQNDFKTPYLSSSPLIGWGHKESLQQGDSHYWGVWWGNDPFETYEKKIGRFMSEYGFQSLPSLQTFKTFCDSSDLNLFSEAVKNHQKHPKGFETITTYMERDFIVPKDFEKFIYVSQLLQTEGMKTAIEAHRRAKPFCMGTLVWQFNDCWPVSSWSAVDFYHTPKAFYYSLNNLYDEVLLSVKKEMGDYKIFIVNDKLRPIDGKLSISVFDFSGKEIFAKKADIKVQDNSSSVYLSISEKEIKGLQKEKMYMRCQFISNDNVIHKKSISYFTSPKNLKLSQLKPQLSLDTITGIIKIKSTTLIKNLYLSAGEAIFSKNYFDLEANEEIQVKLKPKIKNINEIRFMSLNDINQ